MAYGPITSWQIDGETVADFILGGSKVTADGDCSHEIKRRLLLRRKVMTNLDSILKQRHYFAHKGTSSQFSSVHRSVVSSSLRPHELQHARPPCPSPTPGVHPNQSPLSRWCHPIISSSVVPFSSCLQSFPGSESFQMSQLFASGGQVLELQVQHQSFQRTPRTDLL